MNCAQIGPPGSGKTESLKTIAGFVRATKKKFAIIDCDGKARDCQEIKQLEKDGLFEVFDPGNRLAPGTFTDRMKRLGQVPNAAPQGFMAYAGIVDEIEANASLFCGAAIDTVTPLNDHIMKFIGFTNKKAVFEFAEWGNLLNAYKELFRFFYSLPIDLKIINMHSQYEKDENTGRVDLLPKIVGSFRDEAGNFPSEFYLCITKPIQGQPDRPPEYRWRVAPEQRFTARSNIFKGKVDVLQDWSPVWRSLL